MTRILAVFLLMISAVSACATGKDSVVDLEHWDRRPILAGLAVAPLLGKPVIDANRQVIGTVGDVVFSPSRQAEALLVRTPAGNSMVPYEWRRVGISPGAASVVIVGASTPDPIPLPVRQGVDQPRPFLASELIGDRARLDDARTFGAIRDVIITSDGRLSAVMVQLFVGSSIRSPSGIYPLPFSGYETQFQPAAGFYQFPYNDTRMYRYLTRYPQLRVGG